MWCVTVYVCAPCMHIHTSVERGLGDRDVRDRRMGVRRDLGGNERSLGGYGVMNKEGEA